MDKIDSRTLPVQPRNERRRQAVEMRLDEVSLKETAAQCEPSRTTVSAAVKTIQEGSWQAVMVHGCGRPAAERSQSSRSARCSA